MLPCGSLDDVYSYEKMKHQRGNESPQSARISGKKTMSFRESAPQSPTSAKLGGKKTMSFRESAPQSPTSAKLGGKKTSSFRWISWQSDSALGSSKKVAMQDAKESSTSLPSPPKKVKDPSKRIGFVDILIGYHSLLQAASGYPVTRQRKELYPTVGFIRNPDFEYQN